MGQFMVVLGVLAGIAAVTVLVVGLMRSLPVRPAGRPTVPLNPCLGGQHGRGGPYHQRWSGHGSLTRRRSGGSTTDNSTGATDSGTPDSGACDSGGGDGGGGGDSCTF